MATSSILVIDDSATVRQQVRLALEQAGFTVTEAVDGQDAYDKIKGGGAFTMGICDVNMPRMNGIELLEKLQADGVGEKLPIVMLTTEGQRELVARAKAAGAKGWIVKPFKAEMLVAAAKKVTGG